MSMHVIVAGAGIAGGALAQGLKKNGFEVTVLERDDGIGRAGYRLHMNANGGEALRFCLPENLFELYVRTSRRNPRREVMAFIDSQTNELGSRPHIGPPNDSDRPHTAVNRKTLRQILMAGIEENVRFGAEVIGVEQDDAGVTVALADGSLVTGDVLVAADGINSPIRRQLLPDASVVDTGIYGLYSRSPLTDDIVADLPEILLDGFVGVADPHSGVGMALGAWQPRQSVFEAAAELAPDADIDGVDEYMMLGFILTGEKKYSPSGQEWFTATPDVLHELMIAATSDWHPALVGLVKNVDPASIFPSVIRRLDPAKAWAPSRVTFVGDAVHAMPPTFGAGGNTALQDTAVLLRALISVERGEVDLVSAIGSYEAAMRAYSYPLLAAAADASGVDADSFSDDEYAVDRPGAPATGNSVPAVN